MKRFITYLYEYENGRKNRNTGFTRIDIREENVNIEVCVRNYIRRKERGNIYVLIKEKGVIGISIGEILLENGQGDKKISLDARDLMGSRFSVQHVIGIGIEFGEGGYLASSWDEEDSELVGRGEFGKWEPEQENVASDEEVLPQVEAAALIRMPEVLEESLLESVEKFEMPKESVEEAESTDWSSYRKIELNQIHSLPSPNWHFCNNSFLVHGFWNYGYLVLKTEMEENQESLFLGVPGIFEKPEMVMAVLFGFTEFEAIPQEMTEVEINGEIIAPRAQKNQEPKVGKFGCWFVKLQK